MLSTKLITLTLIVQSVIVCCSSVVSAEELFDFEFENDVKRSAEAPTTTASSTQLDGAFEDFLDDMGSAESGEESLNLQEKERLVKAELVRAWKNPKMKRKFAEVLPILKVMSSQQKIALAALVSAQIGAKQGRELNLNQVKVMFGDRKELILPLVLDIANLVKMAAVSSPDDTEQAEPAYSYNSYKTVNKVRDSLPSADFLKALPKENVSVLQTEQRIPNLALSDDRMTVEEKEDEEALEMSEDKSETRAFLVTRSAPFYDHLLKMIPSFTQKPQKKAIIQRREDKYVSPPMLNQKPFLLPVSLNSTSTTELPKDNLNRSANSVDQNITLNEIEDLALTGLNGSLQFGLEDHLVNDDEEDDEKLPLAEMLIGGRHRKKGRPRYPYRKHPSGSSTANSAALCEKFTGGVCLRVEDYPMDQIMGSIRRHKYAMGALLAEYRDKADEVDHLEYVKDLGYSSRREDESSPTPGAMCPSIIRYARPQKARSASGEWKYIVNTGQHTQTLRLEKCSKPQESCTYLTDNFRSRCIQVFNYHRLLSWDKTRGLHVDIFKVPTCCSCRIDGYKEVFPPLHPYTPPAQYNDDYHPSATNQRNPYSTLHQQQHHHQQEEDEEEEEDEEGDDEEEDDEGIAYQYSNGFKRSPKPNYSVLGSPNLSKFGYSNRKKGTKNSGIDSFLSPPTNTYDESIPFKRGPSTSSIPIRKRPSRTNNRDLSVAGSKSEQVIAPKLALTTEKNIRRTTLPNLKLESKADLRHRPDSDSKISELDLSSTRVNYNYHPIIDFFGNEEDSKPETKESRIGESVGDWRPMINGHKSL